MSAVPGLRNPAVDKGSCLYNIFNSVVSDSHGVPLFFLNAFFSLPQPIKKTAPSLAIMFMYFSSGTTFPFLVQLYSNYKYYFLLLISAPFFRPFSQLFSSLPPVISPSLTLSSRLLLCAFPAWFLLSIVLSGTAAKQSSPAGRTRSVPPLP